MPSDRKKKKAAQARAKAQSRGKVPADDKPASDVDVANGVEESSVSNGGAGETGGLGLSDRVCTGVLSSHPESRDLHIDSLTVLFHGHELLQDTKLELNYGRWEKSCHQAELRAFSFGSVVMFQVNVYGKGNCRVEDWYLGKPSCCFMSLLAEARTCSFHHSTWSMDYGLHL